MGFKCRQQKKDQTKHAAAGNDSDRMHCGESECVNQRALNVPSQCYRLALVFLEDSQKRAQVALKSNRFEHELQVVNQDAHISDPGARRSTQLFSDGKQRLYCALMLPVRRLPRPLTVPVTAS
jgi:hypothetical protein